MTIPAISNIINTTIGTITPTSTTVHVDIHLQPSSDIELALILGIPIEVDGDNSDVISFEQ